MMEDKDKGIVITFKVDGKESKMYMNFEEYKLQVDFGDWKEYLFWKYPFGYLLANPGYRIPDREGEEESFENWKLKGKPKASLFSYGNLVKDEASKEFTDLIMSK